MKIKRVRKSRKGRIEIIPMIDIMFFLLATFMLASLSMHNFDVLPVNLTQGKAASIDNQEKITLTIDNENKLFLNKKPIAASDLVASLQPLLRNNKTVIIAADKNSLQGTTTHTMLLARQAGVEHFSIIVKH